MFPVGSIIKRPLRNGWGVVFEHMGVCVEDGWIVHFAGEEKKERAAALRRDRLADFADGHLVELHASPACESHGRAVATEALRQLELSQNLYNGQYHWLFNNCEDFCIACFQTPYGSAESGAANPSAA